MLNFVHGKVVTRINFFIPLAREGEDAVGRLSDTNKHFQVHVSLKMHHNSMRGAGIETNEPL